jgi:hypothetical protein
MSAFRRALPFLLLTLFFLSSPARAAIGGATPRPPAPSGKIDHVIVITVDGVRWQEVFGGAVPELAQGKQGGAPDPKALAARFLRPTPEEARRVLIPFFWGTVAGHGQIFGDETRGSAARLTNGLWFSYPGYNEMLTGAADPRVNSNDKVPNPNVNVFEFLDGRPRFKGTVATVGSWDVASFILNEGRSKLAVNDEVIPFARPANARQRALNAIAADMPAYWDGERFDAVTMQAALETLRTKRPRVMYVMLGDTDEWAHERRYDLYLDLMVKSDRFIEAMWKTAQSMPEYRGRTALVIATDHGRGATFDDWTDHGTKVPAAERVWMAVMGPGVAPLGVRENVQTTLGQVAGTVAALLGEDFRTVRPEAAAPLPLK